MRFRYDPQADILVLALRNGPPVDAVEEPGGGVMVSYGDDGEPVSVEYLHAAARHMVDAGAISVTCQAQGVP